MEERKADVGFSGTRGFFCGMQILGCVPIMCGFCTRIKEQRESWRGEGGDP